MRLVYQVASNRNTNDAIYIIWTVLLNYNYYT